MGKLNLEKTVELMGKEPMNKIGSCFDTAAAHILFAGLPPEARLCHGLGVANAPGQEGSVMAHAWIEYFNDHHKLKLAFDTTWDVHGVADQYREQMKISYVVEYTREEALALYIKHDYPGPWDKKIRDVAEDFTYGPHGSKAGQKRNA